MAILLVIPFAVIDRIPTYGATVATERVAALLARSSFMMQMWAPVEKSLNIPAWTIAIEAVFYLSFPWIGPRIWKLEKRATGIGLMMSYLVGVGACG